MIALFVFTCCVFAVTFIAGQAKISLPIRFWFSNTRLGKSTVGSWILALVECNACSSWWLGAGAFFLHLTPAALTTWWISALYCCATSLVLAAMSGLSDSHD